MQADIRAYIRLENIKHYRNLLDVIHTVSERHTILELLAQEHRKLQEVRDSPQED